MAERKPRKPRLQRREPVVPQRDRPEMPEDPDTEHVPAELRALDGRRVTITGIDRETGELVSLDGELAVAPGIHGDAARRDPDG